MKNITITSLQNLKKSGEKFPVVTGYDASFARLAELAGIEVVLVGDSLGNVFQGHDSTVPVTIDDMVYHTAAVRRGNGKSLLVADLPFMTYATEQQAFDNSAKLMQAGAHMVKLEGGSWLLDTVSKLVERGIPVCGHLGLTPQSVNVFGGFRVQGREDASAERIVEDARALEAAGVDLLVVECVPESLGAVITEALTIPVIGIGAGPATDAQVLVIYDLLGISPRQPKFVKNFLEGKGSVLQALEDYAQEVRAGTFPAEEHGFK